MSTTVTTTSNLRALAAAVDRLDLRITALEHEGQCQATHRDPDRDPSPARTRGGSAERSTTASALTAAA